MSFSKDKHIIIPLFIAFAAVVAFRTWRDMHPPAKPASAMFDQYYLVKSDDGLKPYTANPDDQRPIVVVAGNIVTAKDGTLSVKSQPVKPVSLPQREIIPVFKLDAVPDTVGGLTTILADVTEKWSDVGDIINDIYIDGPKDAKSLAKMLDEVNAIRDTLHDDFWLGLYVDRKTMESLPDAKLKLEEADKSVRTIVLDEKAALKPGEKLPDLIDKLDHDGVLPYLLLVDKAPDFVALHKELKTDPERFVGFLVDAAPPTKPNP